MNPYCVLILSFLIVSINGNGNRKVIRNPGCAPEDCGSLDVNVIHSTPFEQQNQLMFISGANSGYYGALIIETRNSCITVDNSPIIQRKCDGLCNFTGTKPTKSIGLVFKSLPFLENRINWISSKYECDSKMCTIYTIGQGYKGEINIQAHTSADSQAIQNGNSSPKTLHLRVIIQTEDSDLLKTNGIIMLIYVPTGESLSTISSDKENSILFGNIEDHDDHPSVMIGTTTKLMTWKSQTETNVTTTPVRISNLEEIIVNPDDCNLPVACFFKKRENRVYKISVEFEHSDLQPSLPCNLNWSLSIGFEIPSLRSSEPISSANTVRVPIIFMIMICLFHFCSLFTVDYQYTGTQV